MYETMTAVSNRTSATAERSSFVKMDNQKAVAQPVNVTITSDLFCPWCYIGLKKLQQASNDANVDVNIVWKPFLLRPNMPIDGQPKGGTPESRVGSRLKMAGEQVGINFTGLTDRTPNTELFHATMKRILDLHGSRPQTQFQEAVFDAYFTRGIYPNEEALLEIAKQVGVEETVAALYNNPEKLAKVRKAIVCEAQAASRRGISGVPSFSFNGEPAFSGAQDVGTFVRYLEQYSSLPHEEGR